MEINEIITDITKEVDRATLMYPTFNSAHEGWAILKEEVDELWEAVKMKDSDEDRVGAMKEEAIQVGAMAIRFLVDVI